MSLRIFSFTAFAHFASDGSTFLYPVLITFLHTEFPDTNLALLGVFAVAGPIISGIMSTPVGILADRIERKSVLISLGLLLNGISALFFAFSVQHGSLDFVAITAGVAILGVGQSFYHPIGSSLIRSVYGSRTPSVLGLNGSFGSFGRGIFPVIIAALITAYGLVEGMLLMWVLGLAFAAIALVGMGLPKFKRADRAGAKEKRKKVVSGQLALFRAFIAVLLVVVFLRSMVIRSVATYAPSYLASATGSQFLGVLVFTIGALTPVAGQIIFGFVTTRKGGFFSISVTTVMSSISLVLLLLSGSSLILAAVFFSMYAFFTYSGFPTLLGYLNQVVPPEISTSSGGIVWGIGQFVGGAAGIGLASFLVYGNGLYFSFWIMLIFGVAAALLLPLLMAQEKAVRARASA